MTMKNHAMRALPLAFATFALAACDGGASGGGGSRDQIRAVGSSTVYPFAKAVAENLTKSNPGIKSPIIEATGTGAGIELFCKGVGVNHPDIVNASRRIKSEEALTCAKNGVTEIVEIQVGLDGIAFAEAKSGPNMKLTVVDLYKALAANPYGKPNTAKTWKDVNPALADEPILVYGPPATSGTRDALAELVLTKGCDSEIAMKQLALDNKDEHKKICTNIRTDGAYVDAGENDNLIVQKIAANPKAIGVFGFSFLEENTDKIKGLPLGGVTPNYQTVSNFTYPGARPLYIYIKKAHLKAVKGLQEYANEFANAWGPDGYLKKQGMVIAPDLVRSGSAATAKSMTPLDTSMLN